MQATTPSGAGEPGLSVRAASDGVIAQEVDRLAHFGDRVGVGLAGLAHDQADEIVGLRLEPVRRRGEGSPRARSAGPRPTPAPLRPRRSIAAAISSERA